MAFKQPRIPEYRESEGVGKYLKSLVLFLKDFCMESWKATMNLQQAVGNVEVPVQSVNEKTGAVELNADDVGALGKNATAADSAKLGGVNADQYALLSTTSHSLGNNPITSTGNDTTAKWKALGAGFAFYSKSGQLINQPSTYGYLMNYATSMNSDVFQIWNAQSGGPTYVRSGNASGWNGSWRKLEYICGMQQIAATVPTMDPGATGKVTVSFSAMAGASSYFAVPITPGNPYGWITELTISGTSLTVSGYNNSDGSHTLYVWILIIGVR